MNEQQLRRLLQRLAALSAPLPLALLGAACSGSVLMQSSEQGGSGSTAGVATGGTGGTLSAGAGGAIASAGDAPTGSGGGNAGADGESAGAGGEGGGAGWESAGPSQDSAGVGGDSAGAGGDSAGPSGGGGSGGGCKSPIPTFCGPATPVVIPSTCLDASLASAGTFLPPPTCVYICNATPLNYGPCIVSAVDSLSVTITCVNSCPTGGRRPAGLGESPGFCDIGSYFAELARLEAASVPAFRILRDELRSHGAPNKLVRAAARAARDEARHARAARALARRYGAKAHAARVTRGTQRSLKVIAIENAIEGCVRETYAALLATHQAKRASDPLVRAAMTRIAHDETRHAALSWQVARWLDERLDPAARRCVAQAKHAAVRELLTSLVAEREAPFADVVGLPTPAVALALATGMQQTLWS